MSTSHTHIPGLITALRIHRNNAFPTPLIASSIPLNSDAYPEPHGVDILRLKECVASALEVSEVVAVAVPSIDKPLLDAVVVAVKEAEEDHHKRAVLSDKMPSGIVIQVSEWGNFIPALNQLVHVAAKLGMRRICFRSIEMAVERWEMDTLDSMLENDTLVVGKYLDGHQFSESNDGKASSDTAVPLSGVTTPWNTLAVWDVRKLALTGFLMVAEGFGQIGTVGGVEEVSVIALHQKLFPETSKAKLVLFKTSPTNFEQASGGQRNGETHDTARVEWHRKKMESKVSRPAMHLGLLNLDGVGVVQHCSVERVQINKEV
ncbi:hypothetical protein BC829DRAFT_396638 [Chytridium lagenaria]|nr:hypothetical protein BC829DRAFT_396638 [Chytridium lagenaria]